ncbi:MAG: hypothetical protein K2O91_11130 [Lachnospiraceae bacterium]|nr:hypothetical protein [Lachnospiraceae bacterium]
MTQEELIIFMADHWGMSEKEKEIAVKKAKVDELLMKVTFSPFEQFFDSDSDKLLDEKIEVLTALWEGKSITDIPNFYDILELYPGKQEQNGLVIETYWE